jgi:ribosome biogenesis protein ERB1
MAGSDTSTSAFPNEDMSVSVSILTLPDSEIDPVYDSDDSDAQGPINTIGDIPLSFYDRCAPQGIRNAFSPAPC